MTSAVILPDIRNGCAFFIMISIASKNPPSDDGGFFLVGNKGIKWNQLWFELIEMSSIFNKGKHTYSGITTMQG